jgi:hypothetical protein
MAPVYASAGGTALVGSAAITYSSSGAIVASPGANTTTVVHIPITNPANTTDKLSNVNVECDGSSDATIDEVWVYFGKTQILDVALSPSKSSDFDVTPASSSKLPDANPYGIDVSLEIKFSSATATFTIYSVTLTFGS